MTSPSKLPLPVEGGEPLASLWIVQAAKLLGAGEPRPSVVTAAEWEDHALRAQDEWSAMTFAWVAQAGVMGEAVPASKTWTMWRRRVRYLMNQSVEAKMIGLDPLPLLLEAERQIRERPRTINPWRRREARALGMAIEKVRHGDHSDPRLGSDDAEQGDEGTQ